MIKYKRRYFFASLEKKKSEGHLFATFSELLFLLFVAGGGDAVVVHGVAGDDNVVHGATGDAAVVVAVRDGHVAVVHSVAVAAAVFHDGVGDAVVDCRCWQ